MLQPGELNSLFITTHHLHFRRALCRYSVFGLGDGQSRMLRQVCDENGLSQAELARRSNLEPATVTVTLARMEKTGLVERHADADDLRVVRIYPTQEGLRLHETLRGVFLECEEECFRGFSPDEREQLAGYLNRMQKNMTCSDGTHTGQHI